MITLILELSDDVEASLRCEAERRHVLPEEVVLRAINRELASSKPPQSLGILALMEKWNKELEDPANHESFDDVTCR